MLLRAFKSLKDCESGYKKMEGGNRAICKFVCETKFEVLVHWQEDHEAKNESLELYTLAMSRRC